jgi:hypothetical protein
MKMYAPAWLALCEGRFAEAHTGALAAMHQSWEVLEESSWVAGFGAAMAGDLEGLARTAQPLVGAGVSGLHIEAIEAQLEAYRLALEGRGPEAGLLFSSAAEMLRRLDSVLELALLAVARATLIRPADAATLAAVSEAREILTRLGAVPLLALLDAAVGGVAAGADPGQARTTSAEPSSASRASS